MRIEEDEQEIWDVMAMAVCTQALRSLGAADACAEKAALVADAVITERRKRRGLPCLKCLGLKLVASTSGHYLICAACSGTGFEKEEQK